MEESRSRLIEYAERFQDDLRNWRVFELIEFEKKKKRTRNESVRIIDADGFACAVLSCVCAWTSYGKSDLNE